MRCGLWDENVTARGVEPGESGGCIIVDVRGESMTMPRVRVVQFAREFDFIVGEDLKREDGFHLGAFFSKAVLTDDAFNYPRKRRFAVLTESPIDASYRHLDEVVRRFPLIFTHQSELIERGPPFAPLMFGTNWLGVRDAESSAAALAAHPDKSGMVSFMGSLEHPDNGAYTFRREIAQYALLRGDVDCFGKGIRPVAGKHEAIAPYRFSIAMENASADHYFSEKLIDCLLLDTVPIYYGCPGIGELFDVRGLLPFTSRDELAEILDSLTPERYEEILPFALANKQTAITAQWHNYAGLFGRIAAGLHENSVSTGTMSPHRHSRLLSGGRRLWERMK